MIFHDRQNTKFELRVGETKEEAAIQSFGRNYTGYGNHYKDILRRKAYE